MGDCVRGPAENTLGGECASCVCAVIRVSGRAPPLPARAMISIKVVLVGATKCGKTCASPLACLVPRAFLIAPPQALRSASLKCVPGLAAVPL